MAMLQKSVWLLLVVWSCAADKPALKVESSNSYAAVSGSYSPSKTDKSTHSDLSPTYKAEDIKKVIEKVVDSIEERVDKVEEKSDSSYQAPAPAPVSTGNLYYYYYPVAAYPIYDKPKDSYNNRVGNSGYGSGSDLSPLAFLLVPLVILLIAIPFLALIGANVTNGRGFRSSTLDDKFGSFADLQVEVDRLLEKYVSALDSDECMNRIVCELGVRASNIPSKELLFKVIEWLAPNHSLLGKERLAVLKTAATQDYTMETCQTYICNPPAIVKEGITKDTLDQ